MASSKGSQLLEGVFLAVNTLRSRHNLDPTEIRMNVNQFMDIAMEYPPPFSDSLPILDSREQRLFGIRVVEDNDITFPLIYKTRDSMTICTVKFLGGPLGGQIKAIPQPQRVIQCMSHQMPVTRARWDGSLEPLSYENEEYTLYPGKSDGYFDAYWENPAKELRSKVKEAEALLRQLNSRNSELTKANEDLQVENEELEPYRNLVNAVRAVL